MTTYIRVRFFLRSAGAPNVILYTLIKCGCNDFASIFNELIKFEYKTAAMKACFILLLLLSSTSSAFSQAAESEGIYGFKSLKLDSRIDSVKGAKFLKEFDKDGVRSKLFEVQNEELMTLGELKVDKIFVRTFKEIVYEIYVEMDKDVRIMKALEKLYGAAGYDGLNQTYFWKMEKFNIRFKSQSKKRIEIIYHSYAYQQMVRDEKNKKVKSLSDDF